MKQTKSIFLILAASLLLLAGCGSDGGTGGTEGSAGTITMDVADAKPVLPDGVTNLFITFEEVLVHKAGGGWIPLTLVESPYTIDLLQFYGDNSTELVPPAALESGHYTQVRIVVKSATLRIVDGENIEDHTVTIPSENLKTDKQFSFEVEGGGAVHLTVDFDLSESLVVTDSDGTPSYQLKPVLHLVHTDEAATIHGTIHDDSFDNMDAEEAIVKVSSAGSEYTKLTVPRTDPEFTVFWLVPNQEYIVQIDMDPALDNGPEYEETVNPVVLQAGETYELNGGAEILMP